MRTTPRLEAFERRYQVDPATGCWLWSGSTNNRGYGLFWNGTKKLLVHRWAYERFVGPIPAALEVDHLCRVRNCCNPKHMELVTHRENLLRGDTGSGINARKTHCPAGHAYADGNLYVAKRGSRMCRACGREAARKRRRSGGRTPKES